MKQWIKIETDIMMNNGICKLYADNRLLGVAMYFILRLHVESMSDNGISYDQLLRYGNSYTSRKMVKAIIEDYGLFSITDGIVKPLSILSSLTGATTDVTTDATTGTTTDTTTGTTTGSHEPTKDENRKEKSKKKATLSDEEKTWQKEFAEHYPYLARIKEPLTLAQYNKLLERYPNSRIIEKLERMDNMPDFTKKYRCLYRTLLNWLK